MQAMAAEALALEHRIPSWRQGLIPFAKDVDGNFLVRMGQSYLSIYLIISMAIDIKALPHPFSRERA